VVIIDRLRLADRETMAIEHCTSARPSCRICRPATSSDSPSTILLAGTGSTSSADCRRPTVTNEVESEALGVPLHSPAFLFERTARSQSGEIVEYVLDLPR
jgi:GntR family transcriptional regulator